MRKRLHKWVHRVAGSSVALVGLVSVFQGVDFTPILGEAWAAKALTGTGLFIAALEALPFLDTLINGDLDASVAG